MVSFKVVSAIVLLVALAVAAWVLPFETFDEEIVRGKHVLITGASMGIGRAAALQYCQWGAHVVIVSRSESKLAAVVKECELLGAASAHFVVADLSSTDDDFYRQVVNDSVNLMGGSLDTLILNHMHPSSILLEPNGWYEKRDVPLVREVMNTNFFSFLSLTFSSLDYLEATKGKIIIVGSTTGRVGFHRSAAYSSSKHALFGFYNSLRLDLTKAASGVSISTCMIGSIATDSNVEMSAQVGLDAASYSPADCARNIIVLGELRHRDIYYPVHQTFIPRIVEAVFPWLMDQIVLNQF
mmetsp:Transcript_7824/g.14375  ORF Transcript_7824/g.14375 Transcript_7824/m.14375 type:complete len:297 (+) Transcript_7824:237-1127(+)